MECLKQHEVWLLVKNRGKRLVWSDLSEREKLELRLADLVDANLSDANLRYANLCRANLADANLSDADLSDAVLTDANLPHANLSDANLTNANLSGANLSDANLTYANLSGADLSDANLTAANLTHANLADANLRYANLCRANLADANLRYANLCRANLADANLTDAVLTASCLDHDLHRSQRKFTRACPPNRRGGRIVYRTARSLHIGQNTCLPGHTYVAPFLSFDCATDCHPGIYAASMEWMQKEYPDKQLVRCYVRDGDWVISAKGAIRCKRLRVLGLVENTRTSCEER